MRRASRAPASTRRTRGRAHQPPSSRLHRGVTFVSSLEFVYRARPSRVVFGAGSLQHLEREVLALGAERALVLSTPEQRQSAEAVSKRLGQRCAGVFDRAVMHVPMEVAREAREVARELRADCAIAIGGGS